MFRQAVADTATVSNCPYLRTGTLTGHLRRVEMYALDEVAVFQRHVLQNANESASTVVRERRENVLDQNVANAVATGREPE